MKLEQCPFCDHRFKASRHLYSRGLDELLTPRMPHTRINQAFTVRCPSCSMAFISKTYRVFGLISYATMPWLFLAIMMLFLIGAFFF